MNWYKDLKSKVLIKEKASNHTTFKIGGPVSLWIEVFNLDELLFCLKKIKDNDLNLLVVGWGSNLLVSDEGLDRVVLQLKSDYFKEVFIDGNKVTARAGVTLEELIDTCCRHSLSGLEFLTGIPGTLGGALSMNAGLKNRGIGNLIEEVKVVNSQSEIEVLKNKDLYFGYRESSLKCNLIVEAKLKLGKEKKEEILKIKREFLKRKKRSQPLNYASAGCIFKNPLNVKKSSAELIDRAGLKGLKIGEAQVSLRHANFIINLGKATFKDVDELINLIQDKIYKKYKIKLETEIEILKS